MSTSYPQPLRDSTRARWAVTSLRRRLLYGAWQADLEARLRTAIGHVRKDAWGIPDLSSNLFRSSMTQLAALYDRPPSVSHDVGDAIAPLLDEVTHAGLWALMQRVQRDCLGLREMFVRVDVVGEPGDEELSYRPAFPDLIEAEATGEYPEDPVRIREAILRTRTDGKSVWTFDAFDISDPESPSYRIEDEKGADISGDFGLEAATGDAYKWRRSDGTPVMPYALYHAAATGSLFDECEGQELVEATLNLGVHWTFYGHVLTNCSWPQRYMVNCRVPGTALEAGSRNGSHTLSPAGVAAEGIVTDPATVIELVTDADNPGAVMVGQWEPGADPSNVQEAISLYERRAAATGGISPADIQRVAGDPRSGFALAISREGQREAQRKFEPQFRHGDLDLIELSAILWNRATGSSFPEEDYRITYEAIPPSAEERKAEREHLLELLDRGLIDRVSVYRALHPGISEQDATAALAKIDAINAASRAATA